MPKFICKCKNVIDLSGIPTNHQFLFVPDAEYDKFKGDINAEELYAQMRIFIECPSCSRVHIFWHGFDNLPVVYNKEL